jgi:hypothetical protein
MQLDLPLGIIKYPKQSLEAKINAQSYNEKAITPNINILFK